MLFAYHLTTWCIRIGDTSISMCLLSLFFLCWTRSNSLLIFHCMIFYVGFCYRYRIHHIIIRTCTCPMKKRISHTYKISIRLFPWMNKSYKKPTICCNQTLNDRHAGIQPLIKLNSRGENKRTENAKYNYFQSDFLLYAPLFLQ